MARPWLNLLRIETLQMVHQIRHILHRETERLVSKRLSLFKFVAALPSKRRVPLSVIKSAVDRLNSRPTAAEVRSPTYACPPVQTHPVSNRGVFVWGKGPSTIIPSSYVLFVLHRTAKETLGVRQKAPRLLGEYPMGKLVQFSAGSIDEGAPCWQCGWAVQVEPVRRTGGGASNAPIVAAAAY